MKSPITGAEGAAAGSPELNRHLMKVKRNIERTTHTSDVVPIDESSQGWPSMYDLARSMTSGKWGKGGKWK